MSYYENEPFKDKDFTETPLNKGEYEACNFSNCNMAGQDLSELKFIDCTFSECDLSNANLHNASFNDVSFKQCKMLGLAFDICNSFNFSIHCDSCMLNHSIFYQMKLSNSGFVNCQMQDVDFGEAIMNGTELSRCDLRNANFDRSDLQKADLRGSLNYRIDPDNNKLKGAKFSAPEVLSLLTKYGLDIE